MNLAEAKALLPEIRAVLEFASDEWTEGYDLETGSSQICARDGLAGEVYPIAGLLKSISSDDRELMRKAPVYMRALLMLRNAAVDELRKYLPPPEREKPEQRQRTLSEQVYAKCNADRAFVRFLIERHGLPEDAEPKQAAIKVRFLLDVPSLTELNDNPDLAARWFKLVKDFKAWLGHSKI